MPPPHTPPPPVPLPVPVLSPLSPLSPVPVPVPVLSPLSPLPVLRPYLGGENLNQSPTHRLRVLINPSTWPEEKHRKSPRLLHRPQSSAAARGKGQCRPRSGRKAPAARRHRPRGAGRVQHHVKAASGSQFKKRSPTPDPRLGQSATGCMPKRLQSCTGHEPPRDTKPHTCNSTPTPPPRPTKNTSHLGGWCQMGVWCAGVGGGGAGVGVGGGDAVPGRVLLESVLVITLQQQVGPAVLRSRQSGLAHTASAYSVPADRLPDGWSATSS